MDPSYAISQRLYQIGIRDPEQHAIALQIIAERMELFRLQPHEAVGSNMAHGKSAKSTQDSLNAFKAEANIVLSSALTSGLRNLIGLNFVDSKIITMLHFKHKNYTLEQLHAIRADLQSCSLLSLCSSTDVRGNITDDANITTAVRIYLVFDPIKLVRQRIRFFNVLTLVTKLFSGNNNLQVQIDHKHHPNEISITILIKQRLQTFDLMKYSSQEAFIENHINSYVTRLEQVQYRKFEGVSRVVVDVITRAIIVNGDVFAKLLTYPLTDLSTIRSNDIHSFQRAFGLAAAKQMLHELYMEVLGANPANDAMAELFINSIAYTGRIQKVNAGEIEQLHQSLLDGASHENVQEVITKKIRSGTVDNIITNAERIMVGRQVPIGTACIAVPRVVYVVIMSTANVVIERHNSAIIPKGGTFKIMIYPMHKELREMFKAYKTYRRASIPLKLWIPDDELAIFCHTQPSVFVLGVPKIEHITNSIKLCDQWIHIPLVDYLDSEQPQHPIEVAPGETIIISTTLYYACTSAGFKAAFIYPDDNYYMSFALENFMLSESGRLDLRLTSTDKLRVFLDLTRVYVRIEHNITGASYKIERINDSHSAIDTVKRKAANTF